MGKFTEPTFAGRNGICTTHFHSEGRCWKTPPVVLQAEPLGLAAVAQPSDDVLIMFLMMF